MANYNITVISITKTSFGFSGTFSLTDTEFVLSTDGGKTMVRAAATVFSTVETITWDGTLRPKIGGTQGQRKGILAPATVAGEVVQVDWTQGHRGATAAAFMAVWNEVNGGLGLGDTVEVNKTNPKGGRSGGAAQVVTAPVDNSKVDELEKMIKAQSKQMAQLMALLTAKNS